MLKNRIAQLVYYSIYASLGIVAIVSSFGIFNINEGFEWNFYLRPPFHPSPIHKKYRKGNPRFRCRIFLKF